MNNKISYLEKSNNIINELNKMAFDFKKYGDIKISNEVLDIKNSIISCNKKISIYWRGKDRKYSLNQDEVKNNIYLCPKCKNKLTKKTYKMRTKLFACSNPECSFMIKNDDILDNTKNNKDEDIISKAISKFKKKD